MPRGESCPNRSSSVAVASCTIGSIRPVSSFWSLAVANPLRCSAVTINAKAHAEVGGFDPSYRYVVDWDFWLRVARVRPVAWLSKPTVAIRWHPASETHRFKTGTTDLDETIRLLDTFYERDGWRTSRLETASSQGGSKASQGLPQSGPRRLERWRFSTRPDLSDPLGPALARDPGHHRP